MRVWELAVEDIVLPEDFGLDTTEKQLVNWFAKEKVPSKAWRSDPIAQFRVWGRGFDLLVKTESEDWIVEAKSKSSDGEVYKALGQLLFYKYLWETHGEKGNRGLKLICLGPSECSEDAKKFLTQYNIEFVKGELA